MKERLYVEQAGRCFYCNVMCVPTDGKAIKAKDQPDNLFTIDHMVAQKKGGSSHYSNLVGACRLCNLKKGHSTLKAFKEGRAKPYRPNLRRIRVWVRRTVNEAQPVTVRIETPWWKKWFIAVRAVVRPKRSPIV